MECLEDCIAGVASGDRGLVFEPVVGAEYGEFIFVEHGSAVFDISDLEAADPVVRCFRGDIEEGGELGNDGDHGGILLRMGS